MKILVISSNLIGDTILSTGVIKHFSNKYPKVKFTFVIGPSAKSIFKNFKSVETIITVSKKRYNMHWLDIISNCYGKKWDIIIDFNFVAEAICDNPESFPINNFDFFI